MEQKSDCLFCNAAAEWLSAISPELKASSEGRYRNVLNNHLLPEFGERPVSGITLSDAEQYRRKLLLSHPVLSSQTVAGIFSVFRRIMAYACRKYGLPGIELRGLTVRQRTKPLRVLSVEEQKTLTQFLLTHVSLPGAGILLSLYTGLRIGEVCALRWENIRLEEGRLLVQKTMQRVQVFPANASSVHTGVIVTPPKSASSLRTIPLPAVLTAGLMPLVASPDCYFLTGRPDKYMEPRTLENHLRRALLSCGISGATFHTLRHTFATRAVELGFDSKSLSEILGHASVAITMNRYVHPSMEFKRRNMDKLADIFSSIHS